MHVVPLVIDIMRHGDAEPGGPAGDASRALSPTGAAQIRALGARLAANGWSPGRVLTSPLQRARQTALLLLESLPDPPSLETLPELAPEAEPEDLILALSAAGATDGHVVLVSHMPLVSRFCAHVADEKGLFRTAEMVRIECSGALARGTARKRVFPVQDSG